jgi:spoIIIJ-associated protein
VDQRNERRNVVASGKTVDEAIRNGLQMLGVRRNEVDVEIITEGSRGVLGFGAENARVRLLIKEPPKPEPVKRAPVEPPKPESAAPAPAPEPQAAGEEPTAEQVGLEVLSEVLHLMGIRATVETQLGYELADEDEEPPVVLNITGEDLGILIGRRGETLRALQYLVRLMVSHRLKHWTNLVVDVESYLIRRRQSLESLANRMAEQAVRTGRIQALEPMPAYERRLVHIALRKNPSDDAEHR